ncbi:MAG: CerR family C-terminal domain-containing protein [Paludisphaera borealis]|uniref:CerR family C-terminal domain-containing protein n=1 Tax=Paludisphaera borealis TaxID=1387353 RepID=UPI0028500732|nr:CerR family C-terminal domain-containing protein [Paludisphaera borealis]MDR3617855.1 CerR family C-terminal domain-containing protein [Paludisphaera borealis]
MAVQDPTKQRLLEAAGEEFAEKGFELARVRAICERAGANLAAVNYHFGDKEQLYREVLLEAHRCGLDPASEPALAPLSPADKLRAFITHFCEHVIAFGGADSWQTRLMMREIVDPTPALEFLVRESIRPRFEQLKAIMREVRPEADEQRLDVLCFSVIGQCLHYKTARRVMERLIGDDRYQALTASYLADHIAEFTLAALGLGPPAASPIAVAEVRS